MNTSQRCVFNRLDEIFQQQQHTFEKVRGQQLR